MRAILERFEGLEEHYLLVAQGLLLRRPSAVQTVLGSCVAVTFFAPDKGVGAIFHALLPRMSEYESGLSTQTPFRYVDTAIQRTLAGLARLGVGRGEIECKVVGGANGLFREEIGVGRKNVAVALETLAAERLRVAATHAGGARGRKLAFVTATGEVFVKYVSNALSCAGT